MIILKKNPQKDFVVLNLTDPQLGASEWEDGHTHRAILERTITELVERVKPDLITVSGDLAWAGQEWAYEMFGLFLDGFQIPWAAVWGNHDNQEGAAFVEKIVGKYSALKNFVYEKGDPALGNGNYVIGVEENGKIVEAFVMIDSHDKAPFVTENGEEKMEWAKLIPAQLVWYKEQIRNLKEMGCASATVIMHIPPFVYSQASKAAYKAGITLSEVTLEEADGNGVWNAGYEQSSGVQYEGIACYPEEDGVFETVLSAGVTKRILVGHDHVNNFIITYQGIQLIYALKAGAGCYWNPKLNGGTVLKINGGGAYEVKHEYVDISDLLK